MKITIEMPLVAECSVAECAYNVNKSCHARAITVGNGANPGCDTYMGSAGHTNFPQQAGVGACKVRGCNFNKDLECMADSIKVGFHGTMVHCLTYRPRV
jgi:hypothetical protein